MNYMFAPGFIGTRAPFFMDIVTLIVALLPLLVYGAILLARGGNYKSHAVVQNIIFIFSVIIIGYFEMGVRIGGGFDAFISESGVSHRQKTLPGRASQGHKILAVKTFVGIVLTSFSGIWVYLLLFVY